MSFEKILLKPKTNKAKARIVKYGNVWKVLEEKVDKLAIVSIMEECSWSSNSVRWIDKVNDRDFSYDIVFG